MHLCFTCTGKKPQSKDQEIKKKAFSAFWLSCSGNPRNLGARMCIDRSGVLQAAAGFASSSPSSSCTEPRRRTQHQPPLKKGGWNKAWDGYLAANWLLNKHSSWKPALQKEFGFCRTGVEVCVLGKEGVLPSLASRFSSKLWAATSFSESLSSAWISHAAYGHLQTCSTSSYPHVITEPLVLGWGGTRLQSPIPAQQQFGLVEVLRIYILMAWQKQLHHLF